MVIVVAVVAVVVVVVVVVVEVIWVIAVAVDVVDKTGKCNDPTKTAQDKGISYVCKLTSHMEISRLVPEYYIRSAF